MGPSPMKAATLCPGSTRRPELVRVLRELRQSRKDSRSAFQIEVDFIGEVALFRKLRMSRESKEPATTFPRLDISLAKYG